MLRYHRLLLFNHWVTSDSLWPHELQCARLACPSLSSGVCSNWSPLNQWCHPTISSSAVPFCLQSFPASRSFPMSRLFTSGDQSIGASASASVLPMNIQDWFPLGLTGLISLQPKELSRDEKSSGYLERKIMSDIIFWQWCTSTFLRHAFSYIFLFA